MIIKDLEVLSAFKNGIFVFTDIDVTLLNHNNYSYGDLKSL